MTAATFTVCRLKAAPSPKDEPGSPDHVLEARQCASAYRPWSFEQTVAGTEDLRLIDVLSSPDREIDAVNRRETLRRVLAVLPARERRIIGLRFVAEMARSQIAERIGVSQMQVSRLLTRSLTRLRDSPQADGAGAVNSSGQPEPARQVGGVRSSGDSGASVRRSAPRSRCQAGMSVRASPNRFWGSGGWMVPRAGGLPGAPPRTVSGQQNRVGLTW